MLTTLSIRVGRSNCPGSVHVHFLALHSSPFPLESSRPSKSSAPIVSKQSARWQVSKELYQTESNYVGILNTILQVQRPPLSLFLPLSLSHPFPPPPPLSLSPPHVLSPTPCLCVSLPAFFVQFCQSQLRSEGSILVLRKMWTNVQEVQELTH